MPFKWDSQKAKANLRKHRVSFEEASTVFDDFLAKSWSDVEHSVGEERFQMIGMSEQDRLLLVCHCFRHGIVHIFSARKPTSAEAKRYQGGRHV